MPREKIVIGLPTYGQTYQWVNNLFYFKISEIP
jgi:spore germination protein YaaH